MRYFVTGATGFIGRHLVEELLERDGDIHVLVREGSQAGLDDLVAEINTKLGTFGQVAYALMPKAVDQVLHLAYKVFPDSAAAKGQTDPDEKASVEQLAMANLMKGVHW